MSESFDIWTKKFKLKLLTSAVVISFSTNAFASATTVSLPFLEPTNTGFALTVPNDGEPLTIEGIISIGASGVGAIRSDKAATELESEGRFNYTAGNELLSG
ncbi:MAG: hypothetical protein PHE89_00565 [Alphaproteobacteria bacterium]|nr:hypothetical protein [Alphaproteobacteria bacterium]